MKDVRTPFSERGSPRSRSGSPRRLACGELVLGRAFTLIELLVVITIIIILVGLVGGVGIVVMKNQKVSLTKNILLTLDRALDEYMQQTGAPPAYNWMDYREVPGPGVALGGSPPKYFQTLAGYPDPFPRRPDASVFIKQAKGTGEVQRIIGGINEQFLRVTNEPTNADPKRRDATPSIVDAWGHQDWPALDPLLPWPPETQQLIYYVHPRNMLAQDLYGRCVNGRPYFFSAGPDLKYGLSVELPSSSTMEDVHALLEDNVYSYEVEPFNASANFFAQYR